MKCYINCNHNAKAMTLYEQFDGKHNDITKLLYLKACINIGEFEKGEQQIIGWKLIENSMDQSIEIINTLIDFYGTKKDINKAINIFNSRSNSKKDIISINSMMNAYINCKQYSKAIDLFNDTKCKLNNIIKLARIRYI